VLDYGCGNGSFIRRSAEVLPEVEFIGYEIGDKKEIVHHTDRVTIVRASLEDLLPVLPPCRVIIMNHVIEHLPDPFSVVSTLASRLEPGGYFDGQTPNAASFEHKIFGRYWSGYHARDTTVVSRSQAFTASSSAPESRRSESPGRSTPQGTRSAWPAFLMVTFGESSRDTA
jgi:2-polyprenyl-3-methyl-5-hydroxy-6-metoxy-1,4-benzoquinol methylase